MSQQQPVSEATSPPNTFVLTAEHLKKNQPAPASSSSSVPPVQSPQPPVRDVHSLVPSPESGGARDPRDGTLQPSQLPSAPRSHNTMVSDVFATKSGSNKHIVVPETALSGDDNTNPNNIADPKNEKFAIGGAQQQQPQNEKNRSGLPHGEDGVKVSSDDDDDEKSSAKKARDHQDQETLRKIQELQRDHDLNSLEYKQKHAAFEPATSWNMDVGIRLKQEQQEQEREREHVADKGKKGKKSSHNASNVQIQMLPALPTPQQQRESFLLDHQLQHGHHRKSKDTLAVANRLDQQFPVGDTISSSDREQQMEERATRRDSDASRGTGEGEGEDDFIANGDQKPKNHSNSKSSHIMLGVPADDDSEDEEALRHEHSVQQTLNEADDAFPGMPKITLANSNSIHQKNPFYSKQDHPQFDLEGEEPSSTRHNQSGDPRGTNVYPGTPFGRSAKSDGTQAPASAGNSVNPPEKRPLSRVQQKNAVLKSQQRQQQQQSHSPTFAEQKNDNKILQGSGVLPLSKEELRARREEEENIAKRQAEVMSYDERSRHKAADDDLMEFAKRSSILPPDDEYAPAYTDSEGGTSDDDNPNILEHGSKNSRVMPSLSESAASSTEKKKQQQQQQQTTNLRSNTTTTSTAVNNKNKNEEGSKKAQITVVTSSRQQTQNPTTTTTSASSTHNNNSKQQTQKTSTTMSNTPPASSLPAIPRAGSFTPTPQGSAPQQQQNVRPSAETFDPSRNNNNNKNNNSNNNKMASSYVTEWASDGERSVNRPKQLPAFNAEKAQAQTTEASPTSKKPVSESNNNNNNSRLSPTTSSSSQPQQQQAKKKSKLQQQDEDDLIDDEPSAEVFDEDQKKKAKEGGKRVSGLTKDALQNSSSHRTEVLDLDGAGSVSGGSQRSGRSGHRSGNSGDSSNYGTRARVMRCLGMIPGKDTNELLMKDADASQLDDEYENDMMLQDASGRSPESYRRNKKQDPNNLQNLCDELEECASTHEKTKRFFEEVLDNPFTAAVVIEAATQTIIYANQFACFMFNLVESDLVGQDVSMLMGPTPGRDNKIFHHRKIANFLQTWSQKGAMPDSKIASGRVQELVACRFEGIKKIPFPVQMVVRPIRSTMVDERSPPVCFVGYFKEYATEKQLKQSLSMQRSLHDEASEAIVVMDLYGKICNMNLACGALFGYDEKFLLKTEANIKLFMPESVAKEHDRYLKTFREKLRTPGFDLKTSPIVAKERMLTGRRVDGVELPIYLRVEYHVDHTRSGNDRLIGYIRDRRALIKASDFNLEVSKRLFPESIAKIVSQKTDIRLVETYRNIPVILLNMVNTGALADQLDNESQFDLVNEMFKALSEIATGYQVEIVKSAGDGLIAVCGIDEFDERKSRMDRAVAFALHCLRWAQENNRTLRAGIGYGDLGSAVFEISKGRPSWDIWATAINESSRMEKNAEPQTLQVTVTGFKALNEAELRAYFRPREYEEGIKGMQDKGEKLQTYQTPYLTDHKSTTETTERILNASMSRVYLKKENARELKEQQERRALTSA